MAISETLDFESLTQLRGDVEYMQGLGEEKLGLVEDCLGRIDAALSEASIRGSGILRMNADMWAALNSLLKSTTARSRSDREYVYRVNEAANRADRQEAMRRHCLDKAS